MCYWRCCLTINCSFNALHILIYVLHLVEILHFSAMKLGNYVHLEVILVRIKVKWTNYRIIVVLYRLHGQIWQFYFGKFTLPEVLLISTFCYSEKNWQIIELVKIWTSQLRSLQNKFLECFKIKKKAIIWFLKQVFLSQFTSWNHYKLLKNWVNFSYKM